MAARTMMTAAPLLAARAAPSSHRSPAVAAGEFEAAPVIAAAAALQEVRVRLLAVRSEEVRAEVRGAERSLEEAARRL